MGLAADHVGETAAVLRDGSPSSHAQAFSRLSEVERGPNGAVAMRRIAVRTRLAIDQEKDSHATRRRRPDRP